MKQIKASLLAIMLSWGMLLCAQEIGQPAPDFMFEKLNGGIFKLSDNEGKVVMIFVFGYGCPYCVGVGPSVQSELVDMFDDNPDFVAVGIDTWDGPSSTVQTFKENTGLEIPLLLMGSSFASSYNTTYDRLLVVGADGNLLHRSNQTAENDLTTVEGKISQALGEVLPVESNAGRSPGFAVFPNPASERLTVSMVPFEGSGAKVSIVAPDGRLLRESVMEKSSGPGSTLTFDISDLPSGLYLLSVEANGERSVQQIAIR